MSRRRLSSLSRERRQSGFQVPGASPLQLYRQILGSTMVECWHAQYGIGLVGGAVDTWTGQIAGTVLQAPGAGNRMAYGADGSNWRGMSVCTSVRATPTYVTGTTGISALLPIGSQPYTFRVQRYTSAAVANQSPFNILTGDARCHKAYTNVGPPLRPAYFSSVTNLTPAGATDQAPHAFEESFSDGTNSDLSLDGVSLASAALNVQLTSAATRVDIGYDTATPRGCDGVHALVILCTSRPTAAQRAAVLSIARQEWNF